MVRSMRTTEAELWASFLESLKTMLLQRNPGTSMALFGSSVEASRPKSDTDILFVAEDADPVPHFEESVSLLRRRLLTGSRACGFETNSGEVGATVHACLAQREFSSLNLVPKFVFGPFRTSANGEPLRRYLHFKGPISTRQLEIFARVMPFHCVSILKSARILVGHIDSTRISRHARLDDGDLQIWANSLRIRINRYPELEEISRCTRKLLLLYSVFREWNPSQANILMTSALLTAKARARQNDTEVRKAIALFESLDQLCAKTQVPDGSKDNGNKTQIFREN